MKFPALAIDPRVWNSWSASKTYDRLFFLPIIGKIEALKIIFTIMLYDSQLQMSFVSFRYGT